MNMFGRSGILLPLVSIVTALALPARAQDHDGNLPKTVPAKPAIQAAQPGPAHAAGSAAVHGPQTAVRGPHNAHVARGAMPSHHFDGRAYHGRLAWQGGRWHHERRDGRDGWWWDVGGAWYYYPQPMEGPPAYVSDVEVIDEGPGPYGPPVAAGYPPPRGAYAPPPPPPPAPDPAASAVGGAIVGGLLGGLLSGRPEGAVAGAITGGATGAIVGAQAAQRPGYYLSQGGCYYRYPSGQYVAVDPRSCD